MLPNHTLFFSLLITASAAAQTTPAVRPPDVVLPKNQILVKGATPASSDSTTPLPEQGTASSGSYLNRYFGLNYPVPTGWTKQADGPPPSDGGSFVLGQFAIYDDKQERVRANVLLTAQDLFFGPLAVSNGGDLVHALRDSLQSNFKLEPGPAEVTINGRTFTRLGYTAPVAGLHWRILSTDVRCHALRFTFTGTDTKLLDSAERALSKLELPAPSDEGPACIAGYASGENVLEKTEPRLANHRFNSIPVRILIDADGRVKHVHILSAFPEQADEILAAVKTWRFKPYLRDGKPAEVETGVVFGLTPTVIRKTQ
ncbi:MAG: energy transducer TonB [Thermoanaerobaculia bacterium]